jgi:RHS repeat-associated protein
MPGREYTAQSVAGYRFGFNGKEMDDEISGDGNAMDFGARIYDNRLGKWLSLDPLQFKHPNLNPYGYCRNNPVIFVDPDGKDFVISSTDGGAPDASAIRFFNLLNERCGGVFQMDLSNGVVTNKLTIEKVTDNKVSQELAKQVQAGISSPQIIKNRIVDNSNETTIDSYESGKIDVKDIENMSDPIAQNAMMAHIIGERFTNPNYEATKDNKPVKIDGKTTETNGFRIAHIGGIDAEIRVISEMTKIPLASFGEGKDCVEVSNYSIDDPIKMVTPGSEFDRVVTRTYKNNVVFTFGYHSKVQNTTPLTTKKDVSPAKVDTTNASTPSKKNE